MRGEKREERVKFLALKKLSMSLERCVIILECDILRKTAVPTSHGCSHILFVPWIKEKIKEYRTEATMSE